MAESSVTSECFSHNNFNKEGITEFNLCERCKERELQLKEALEELSSLQLINKLLQKELLTQTTWESNQKPYGNHGIPIGNENDWSTVTTKAWRVRPNMNSECKNSKTSYRYNNLTQQIPPTNNRYEVLYRNNEISEHLNPPTPEYKYGETSITRGHQTITGRTKILESKRKVKHSVLIVGDNHASNAASLLQDNLNSDYEVSGFVKHGAHMKAITDTAEEIVRTLSSEDVIIIWGGSTDLNTNNSKDALKSVYEFVNKNADSNIVLINAPLRHDLPPESCVNAEVMKFNRQLKKIVKFQNTHLLEINSDRDLFTKHGMYLNHKGKDQTAHHLAAIVEKILCKEQDPINNNNNNMIPLINLPSYSGGEMDHSTNQVDAETTPEVPLQGSVADNKHDGERAQDRGSQEVISVSNGVSDGDVIGQAQVYRLTGDDPNEDYDNIQEQNENSKQQEKEAVGIATRRSRMTPVTRSEDFLWTTTSKRQAR
jgi:hypothetical protein